MQDQSSSEEKTEEATPKRLRDARKKGQVARSRDLDTIIMLIASFVAIIFMYKFMADNFKHLILTDIEAISKKDLSLEEVFLHGRFAFITFLKLSLPYALGLATIAAVVGFLQIGPIFSAEPIKPQTKRLNMIENIKQKFKMTTLIELLKNIAKVTLIFLLAYLVIFDMLREVILTIQSTPEKAAKVAAEVTVLFLMKVFVVFIAVAIIDVFVQRWQYHKQLRMTKDEVKREYKQDEGDPLLKSIRKQLHQELAMGDVAQSVAASDVVITNPTELAIAIKYDEKEMVAPRIMAKGQRIFAGTIRDFANKFNVPIVQNPPLAWTLVELDVGDDIPEEVYQAVAEILVIVYKMRSEKGE